MPFAAGPDLTYRGLGQYETAGETVYQGATDTIRIPAGFRTDLASVPRLFWALLPPDGVYEKAAVVHDWHCIQLAAGNCTISSHDADGLFRRMAREEGTGLTARWLLWTGVRWGAVFNPARRRGWWRDAPAVLAISALAAATVLAVLALGDVAIHPLLCALAHR